MKHCLKGEYINEVPNFLADSPSDTTDVIQVSHPPDAVHPLDIHLLLHGVNKYYNVYLARNASCENKDIHNIHLTAQEPPWISSTDEFSVREAQMIDH